MTTSTILNGVPWFDDNGDIVNAHASCILEDAGTYYLFGEYKTDDVNRFNGFSCYSSPDLSHWTHLGMALAPQPDGLMGPDRVGERVKVMRCPSTGKYVMYAHSDDMRYMDPHIIVAQADAVAGPYTVLGALTCNGEPIRKWDMGTFQDDDGTGYLLLHEGDIYRLSADYLTAEELVAHEVAVGGESPAMAHIGDAYYLMFSNKTGWDRNDNYYLTAPTPAGPWTNRGLFAPEGTCTWDSQCSFIFPLTLADGTVRHVYTGDRWSYPHQASSATYVWLPLEVKDGALRLDGYMQVWDSRTAKPVADEIRALPLVFRSNVRGAGAHASVDVNAGERVQVLGLRTGSSGYATVELTGSDGYRLHTTVDFYTPACDCGERIMFESPELPAGRYDLSVTVDGEHGVWATKNGTAYGSDDNWVTVSAAAVVEAGR
ncbi:family 43 glycosylhydrolase [Bifidobacterium vespertilionis]|uniref:Glycosyl hydrolase family 43 n=1 Tax=Bifidobacterium vespertilionis TaxID=2562524 RepID=A0A5J5DSP2_9BIFI|nr:family 43 glycosylhydrolase [Bifidobacterium vespertilionis]KAA8816897.1 glycosyl hydrolase family 43 [Bifidobacterium vespertilionis]KAA8821896.1 glycosyl hydrolase family 43 [Bifidobacterium vespertilionis]